MEDDTDEEDMKDVKLDDDRKRNWRIFLRKIIEGWMIRRHCYMLSGGILK